MRLILSTVPDKATAKKIGHLLIEKKLAGCIHIYPAIESLYRWQNKTESAYEIPIVIKTTADNCQAIEDLIKTQHSYAVPEIIIINADASSDYLDWLLSNCK